MLLRMMLMAPLMLIGASFMAYQSEKRLTGVFLVSIPLLLVAIAVIMYFAVPLFKGLQKKIDRSSGLSDGMILNKNVLLMLIKTIQARGSKFLVSSP